MTSRTPYCPSCGSEVGFEPGFILDSGEGSRGYTKWIRGELETGVFGGARIMGKDRYAIAASRCQDCGFLALFAREQA